MNFGQFADGVTLTDTSELVGYTPPAGVGVPYNRWTGLEVYTYIQTKLNLGGAALLNVGTTTGTVAAGDDSRITGALQKTNNLSDVANATTALTNILPSQTGQTGKVLTTNGTVQAWGAAGATGPIGTGSTGATISSLQSNPDIDVGTGIDDEFVENTSGVPSGWTAIPSGTPNTIDTNTAYSLLHMVANGGGGSATELQGIYIATPSTPFTVTCKLSDWSIKTSDQAQAGLFVGVAGASGAFMSIGSYSTSSPLYADTYCRLYTNRSTASSNFFSTGIHLFGRPAIYYRMVVHSTTNVDLQQSYNGFDWFPCTTAKNPGFTIGSVGLFVDAGDSTIAVAAHFDWIRFT